MPVEIVYDNEADAARGKAIREGHVYADIEEGVIRLSWSNHMDGLGSYSNPLKELGGKKVTNTGGYLALSLTNCKGMREHYGKRLHISDELNDWAFDEIERLGSIENLSAASSDAQLSAAFKLAAPAIARIAHPYQRAGIAFCAATARGLLADQPGLGKTLQTIGTMIEADVSGDILVLAPTAAVAITWPDELRTWVPNDEVVCVVGQGRQRHKLLQDTLSVDPIGKRRWIIANLEMARAQWVKPTKEYRKPKVGDGEKRWFNVPGWWSYSYPELFGEFKDGDEIVETPPWAAVVVDESHRCLIAKTGTLQGQTQIRAGMAQIPVAEGGIKLALSGTPMRGKPENLWGTLNWLYPDRYSSYWNWARRWFVVWGEDASKAGEIEGLDESKAKDFYDDIKSIMLRRTKKEVRPELPDKLYAGTPLPDENGEITDDSPVGHWVHMSPKQKKAYEDMQQNSETLLDSGILVANGVLAELTRLKQFATCFGDLEHYIDSRGDDAYKFIPKLPSAKFDWIVDFLETLGINKDSSVEPDEDEEVRKVVIASQFTSVLDLYDAELQRLGIKTLKITGKVSQKQRKIAKDTWQEEGGPRVFLLNTQAGGVSLTLDAADDLVFLDETWIPDDQEQVEDRIHRVSRMHQVTIHYLRTLGTVEENIALTTGSRERITKMLIDGQRGVSFARKLLTPIKRAA